MTDEYGMPECRNAEWGGRTFASLLTSVQGSSLPTPRERVFCGLVVSPAERLLTLLPPSQGLRRDRSERHALLGPNPGFREASTVG